MTKQNKIIQTVFNFVTVRPPQKIEKSIVTDTVITYPEALSSNFYEPIKDIIDKEPDISKAISKIAKIANGFAKSEKLLTNEIILNDIIDKSLIEFGEWLATNKTKVTTELVVERLKEFPVKSEISSMETLWDNMIYYSIIGHSNPVVESIIYSLRAENFLNNFERYSEEDLRKIAQAEVILPKAIFPLPSVIEPKEIKTIESENPKDDIDVSKLQREIQLYKDSIDELDSYYQRQKEIIRNTFDVDNSGIENPKNELINKEEIEKINKPFTQKVELGKLPNIKSFSRRTQDTLKRINANDKLSIPFITKELQKNVDLLTRELWENVNLNRKVFNHGGALWVLEDDISYERDEPREDRLPYDVPKDDYDGFYFNDGKCRIKPLGIADFRRVEQELCCYKPGEVAHIENILQGEYKERSTRRLKITENTVITETEREEENERDTITTDRFEMQKEASKIIKKDTSFDLGVSIAGGFGPVSVTVDSNFSTSTSTSESDRQAVFYGKNVTQRSLQRVIERVREERISTVIEEFEENNKHGLDNRLGDKHVVGLFRWVDKIYKAQVVNYGKRLMFEFMIPEPAAFHLWAMAKPGAQTGLNLEEPIDPRSSAAIAILGKSFKKHTDIDDANFALLAAQYGASVTPPPSKFITVEKNYSRDNLNPDPAGPHFSHGSNDLQIPQGYNPIKAHVLIAIDAWVGDDGRWLSVTVGNDSQFVNSWNKNGIKILWLTLPNEVTTLPVNICGRTRFYSVNINVECERVPETYEAWQIKIYKAVLDAYEAKRGQYEAALAEAKAQRGVDIQGTNPAMNRQIEQQELKKGCISWLHYGQGFTSNAVSYYSPTNDWTTRNDNNDCNSPITDYSCSSVRHSERVKFFEQVFEWKLMTYNFYQYFWGNKCRWRKLYQLNDIDPLFANFLQAGMARVLVPVRPGFEKVVMHFLRTGQIWQGGDVPAINSPIYLSIVEEMKEPIGTVEGDPWEVRVPTSLTVLQCGSGCVEGDGLPCECDPDNGFGVGTGGSLTGTNQNGEE